MSPVEATWGTVFSQKVASSTSKLVKSTFICRFHGDRAQQGWPTLHECLWQRFSNSQNRLNRLLNLTSVLWLLSIFLFQSKMVKLFLSRKILSLFGSLTTFCVHSRRPSPCLRKRLLITFVTQPLWPLFIHSVVHRIWLCRCDVDDLLGRCCDSVSS